MGMRIWHDYTPPRFSQAFSLVELSIVLVILGLLVGGVLAGQSLIRAAELRSISTEYSRYVTAMQSFRDKYFAIPGDMTNATQFWGKDAALCNAVTDPAGTPGTCNGNGNGVIAYSGTAGATAETWQSWKQLALAGLIEGTYSGAATAAFSAPGTNVPASRLANSDWVLYNISSVGSASNYAMDWGNALTASQPSGTLGVLRPEEAWNIDTKIDDGKPGSGKVTSLFRSNCDTSTSPSDFNGAYALTVTSQTACGLRFGNVI